MQKNMLEIKMFHGRKLSFSSNTKYFIYSSESHCPTTLSFTWSLGMKNSTLSSHKVSNVGPKNRQILIHPQQIDINPNP